MRFDMIMDEEQYEDLLNTIEDGEGLFDADDTGPREYKKISELQGSINLYTQINCTIVRDESPHEVELEFGLGHSGLCDSDGDHDPKSLDELSKLSWNTKGKPHVLQTQDGSPIDVRVKNEAGTGFRHLRVCYAIFERSTTPESIVRLGDDQWGIQGAIVLHTIASLGKGADDVFSSESRPLKKPMARWTQPSLGQKTASQPY